MTTLLTTTMVVLEGTDNDEMRVAIPARAYVCSCLTPGQNMYLSVSLPPLVSLPSLTAPIRLHGGGNGAPRTWIDRRTHVHNGSPKIHGELHGELHSVYLDSRVVVKEDRMSLGNPRENMIAAQH